MKCPYNRLSETQIQQWEQDVNDDNVLTQGKTVTQTTFKLMECERENCGVYYNGKCCYSSINFENC